MIIPFVSTAVLLTAVVAAQSSLTAERPCTDVSGYGYATVILGAL
jgi:hypothetical protein